MNYFEMTINEIARIRLFGQKIEGSAIHSPNEIVRWMGAMQAQDFPMAKWAVGIRLKDKTEKEVTEAYDKGEILRTHVMRPTWHLVVPEDIYWMLDLTAPVIIRSIKSRHSGLELSGEVVSKSLNLFEGLLLKEKNCTRDELALELKKAKIRTDENRMSHLLLLAELNGLICSGPMRGNKITYTLLSERVPEKKTFNREDSLAKLAFRYFSSHYPATIKDFSWWSGLSLTDAKKGLESIKKEFYAKKIDQEEYWLPNSFSAPESSDSVIILLPAYDEFLISYRDRKAALSLLEQKRVVSSNGMFWPTIVWDGQVVGLWKKSLKKQTMLIEAELIQEIDHNEQLLKRGIEEFGLFNGKKADLVISYISN